MVVTFGIPKKKRGHEMKLSPEELAEMQEINNTHNVHIGDTQIARYRELMRKKNAPEPLPPAQPVVEPTIACRHSWVAGSDEVSHCDLCGIFEPMDCPWKDPSKCPDCGPKPAPQATPDFDGWISRHVKKRDQYGFTHNDLRDCWNASKAYYEQHKKESQATPAAIQRYKVSVYETESESTGRTWFGVQRIKDPDGEYVLFADAPESEGSGLAALLDELPNCKCQDSPNFGLSRNDRNGSFVRQGILED